MLLPDGEGCVVASHELGNGISSVSIIAEEHRSPEASCRLEFPRVRTQVYEGYRG